MPVLAVAGEDVVVRLERGEAADDRRLLADVQVAVAADLRFGVLLLSAFFKAPDQLHLAMEAEQEVAVLLLEVERLRRDRRGGWRGLDRGCHLLHSILLLESTHLPIDGEVAGSLLAAWGGGAGHTPVSDVNRATLRGERCFHQ